MIEYLIVHPGTGTVISLSDEVLLARRTDVEDDLTTDVDPDKLKVWGIRIDNANMGRLFFGDDA